MVTLYFILRVAAALTLMALVVWLWAIVTIITFTLVGMGFAIYYFTRLLRWSLS